MSKISVYLNPKASGANHSFSLEELKTYFFRHEIKVNMPGSSSTKAKTLANSIKSMKSGSGAGSGNMFGGSGGGSGMFGSGGMPSAGGIQNMVSGILGKSGISGFGFAAFKQKGSNTMPSYIKTRQTSNLKMVYSPKLGN